MCEHILLTGKNKHQQCQRKKTSDSQYCSVHKKQHARNEDRRVCIATLISGKKKGDPCSKFAVVGSVYCTIHRKKLEKKPKVEEEEDGDDEKEDSDVESVTGSVSEEEEKPMKTCRHVYITGKKIGQKCRTKIPDNADICNQHKYIRGKIEKVVQMPWDKWVVVRAEFLKRKAEETDSD